MIDINWRFMLLIIGIHKQSPLINFNFQFSDNRLFYDKKTSWIIFKHVEMILLLYWVKVKGKGSGLVSAYTLTQLYNFTSPVGLFYWLTISTPWGAYNLYGSIILAIISLLPIARSSFSAETTEACMMQIFLFKEKPQGIGRELNRQRIDSQSNTLPLSHCVTT